MPFYEYECESCKYYVEVMQKISDAPLKKCPSCGKNALKKLVSAPVFRLKGSGWYETDFKSDKENKRNLAEREESKESKPAEAAAESKTTESKPAEAKASAPAEVPTGGSTRKSVAMPKPVAAAKKPAAKPAPKPKPKVKAKAKGKSARKARG